jgi:hypothetical protein
MKYRSLIAVAVAAVLLCAVSGLFAGQYLMNGCLWWECAPERIFHVRDWEIPMTFFPEGSYADHISAPTDGSNELEGGFQSIYVDQGVVIYNIYRFPKTKDAVAEFEHNVRNMIDRETGKQWHVPSNLTFSSTTADDEYIACGYWSNRYRCQMTARYQEFVIFLNADINDKMTFGNFENVAVYLDEQLSSRLYP